MGSAIKKMWYSPPINLGLRASVIFIILISIGVASNQISSLMTALMMLPAALISGLDTAGPKRWIRLFITAIAWCLSIVLCYTLLETGLPLWLVYGGLAALFVCFAANGAFWGRLGMSCLLMAVVSLSLHNLNTEFLQYIYLVIGPLAFALLSWLWFAIWKHFALRVGLSAIYDSLSELIKQRTAILLGEHNEAKGQKLKYQLVELFEQAIQSESFRSQKQEVDPLRQELFLALDIFEGILASQTKNPELIYQFEHDVTKRELLLRWSECCQLQLKNKAAQFQHRKTSNNSYSCIATAEQLIDTVKGELEQQARFKYWAATVKHISRRIELNEQSYERKIDIQPFQLTWHIPSLSHPIWRHVARVSFIFAAGAGVAETFKLIHPEWVLIPMIMVIQPTFAAIRSKIWHRCLGTITGLCIATVLIHIGIPTPYLLALVAVLLVTAMLNIMRNYGIAIGCVTAILVLITQVMTSQGIDIVIPRVMDNVIGCLLVLVSYAVLWPQWRGNEIHDQALKSLGAAKVLFLNSYQQLQQPMEQRAPSTLTQLRGKMLVEESSLELIYKEMLNEPQFTRRDPLYYEEMLNQYRLLSHYLCLLVPLVRKGTQQHVLKEWEAVITSSMDALINSVKTQSVVELPIIDEDLLQQHQDKLINERAAYELMWLSLMTVKQMHDLVRDKNTQVVS